MRLERIKNKFNPSLEGVLYINTESTITSGGLMRGLKIVLTILLCLWICTHQAGVASAQQQVEKSVEVTSVLKYLLYLPEGYEEGNKQQKWPLMIFLHGSGERGRDLNLVKKWGPPKRVEQGEEFPFILVS
ncbi:MAG: hypothetical protein AAGA30_02945, partial [Planctomycetota bacterium]